ncbi:MAG: PhoX family phosphatase [Rickettsiales bacterium]|nr:PhoX family phosphatase [Rickettsiales bacterium]
MQPAQTLEEIIETRRINRRQFLGLGGILGGLAFVATTLPLRALANTSGLSPSTLTFTEIAKRLHPEPAVAHGYSIQPLLSWGDPLFPGGDAFDPLTLTAEEQSRRFGYNNDFTAYVPLNPSGSRGLLCVNHEYTILRLMFPQLDKKIERFMATQAQGRIEQEAQGVSVVEIMQEGSKEGSSWKVLRNSMYNRRITATTPITIRGPAAGNARMKTSVDPEGKRVLGTFANCAGGITPWGTVLTCEENFDQYFSHLPDGHADEAMRQRYTIGNNEYYNWHAFDSRFDVTAEPNECNRFGWVVEYDPHEPHRKPIKRTALGRFKHECATCVVSHDGHVVVYSGDDQVFEYIYRFVSKNTFDPNHRAANRHLLDEGVLSVARFLADGELEWLPLIFGEGPLTPANGFNNQGEVVIYARRAADLVGATPMDRPEDIEVTTGGRVYVSLTKNYDRKKNQRLPSNRRGPNPYGHLIEMVPPKKTGGHDHTARRYRWDIFLEGGDPAIEAHQASYIHRPSVHGWLTNPDNLTSDQGGNLWVCTDGQEEAIQSGDGIYAIPTRGVDRGKPKLFFTAPIGAEVTGPTFTPNGKTLFVSIQHPGDSPESSTFRQPSTRWPVSEQSLPPRPTVIAITKDDGGVVGS